MAKPIEDTLADVLISELRLELGGAVAPDTTVSEVYELLDRRRINAVVVCAGDAVVGIFTQRDILYRTALEALDPATPIAELMTPDPFTLRIDQQLADAIHAMTVHGYRNVPLVDADGRWLGLLSSRNVLRFIAAHFPEAVLNLPPRLDQHLARSEGG
jgi:CBS domain-containing protein